MRKLSAAEDMPAISYMIMNINNTNSIESNNDDPLPCEVAGFSSS